MNRKILFRGFHECEDGKNTIVLDNKEYKGEWVYGDLIHSSKAKNTCYISNDDLINKDFLGNTILPSVISATVSQYTGLNDKDDNMIFENDVIMVLEKFIDYVKFEKGCFYMAKQICFCEFTYQDSEDMKILGTIFDKEVSK